MIDRLKDNWPIYAIEAWCLGTFMLSACAFSVLLFHPASPATSLSWTLRNALMGAAMGATAVAIIRSPWGRRSGAHFNPAVTLALFRVGRIDSVNATFYIAAHFVGGFAGVALSYLLLGGLLSDGAVNFAATMPSAHGIGAAFAAEAVISFLMMATILFAGNSQRWSHLTPYLAGCLLAVFITFVAPISGTSLNPARSVASAIFAGWTSIWIYFLAPTLAMLAAAEFFVRFRGRDLSTPKTDRACASA
jgi:aquaporin Z